MRISVQRSVAIVQTPRVKQMSGLFDVAPAAVSAQSWEIDVDLPVEWNVGVIVGPSGAGKTTAAGALFAGGLVSSWPWPVDKSILDGFPCGMSIKEITGLLCSVGFSSPPAWLRPFGVLSNGQQFRVHLARTLAEKPDLAVVDEFTSVVDRTVAQIASAAVAKTVRRRRQKFVAITCHYDVLDWLEPDWVFEPHTGKLATGRLRRRPPIELQIVRASRAAWTLFKPHHYLSAKLHPSVQCFVALYGGRAVAFTAVIYFPHAQSAGWREHRTVCLPDFQGVGIGNAMSDFIASIFAATGLPYASTTSHPAMIRHRARSRMWRMIHAPGLSNRGRGALAATRSIDRLTAGFRYIGPSRPAEARQLGINVKR